MTKQEVESEGGNCSTGKISLYGDMVNSYIIGIGGNVPMVLSFVCWLAPRSV